MITHPIILLLFLSFVIINPTYGYVGCPDPFIPCANKTDCIDIKKVCIDNHSCDDGTGKTISCHPCPINDDTHLACVTMLDSHLAYECLSSTQICNGVNDCLNGEDEQLCNKTRCPLDHWLCANEKCISTLKMCDNKVDCADGSDEYGPNCDRVLCKSNNIHCSNGQCIPIQKKCDGINDCPDGYDERNCSTTTLSLPSSSKPSITVPLIVKDSCSTLQNGFTCSTARSLTRPICIPHTRVCNGYQDCPMGDDESDCDTQCMTKSICGTMSDVTCLEHPRLGSLCRCVKPGYRLTKHPSSSDAQICQDYNECHDPFRTYCSYHCSNSDGAYECSCPTGFALNNNTKTCQKTEQDESKPDLLILFDQSIRFYRLEQSLTSQKSSSSAFTPILLRKGTHLERIQYDHLQKFIIYYDSRQQTLFCHSQKSTTPIALLSNLKSKLFAYDPYGRVLFTVDTPTRSLRLYYPITCDQINNIKVNVRPFDHRIESIHSMELDVSNGRILYASNHEFFIANISTPTDMTLAFTSDRPIQRFIFDPLFQRIFWTASNMTTDELYPVYTCNNHFQLCHDTLIRLPSAWPFAFFNDSFIYIPLSSKSLETVQAFGKNRFINKVLTTTHDDIQSMLVIHQQLPEVFDRCAQFGDTLCPGKLCIQINKTTIDCLPINGIVHSQEITASADMDTYVQLNTETLMEMNNAKKKSRIRSIGTILTVIVFGGLAVLILAKFGKRYHQNRRQRSLLHEDHQHEHRLTMSEPILDEFNISPSDRNDDRLPLTEQLHY